jgi:drug/metabolite transporter (DMT)-like permease
VFAVTGVMLAAYQPAAAESQNKRIAAGVGMALLAALGIGSFFALINAASDRGDIVSAVFVNRVVAVALLAIAVLGLGVRVSRLPPRDVAGVASIGLLAVGATLLFAAATTKGLVSLVAVVAALYPVTTVVLARILLGERVRRPQRLGAAAALVGVGMIAT